MKLVLEDVRKTYDSGETVHALRGVSLGFRKSEFVSILGPSGCGKTTLLNIIGGLDHYSSGNLIINGISTKKFKDNDWDAYRNRSIGFVFQTYNLISHQSVLQNVEIALTLSGVTPAERRKRAKQALADVGLEGQMRKRPNQLSGGQMQRVAIARALVNDPDIILADEPTGALDSHTSVQIMEILKEISATRLVIMVTHNGDLADKYSGRIIRLLDGEVQSDSNPPSNDEDVEKAEKPIKKTSMSLFTATSLSLNNLLTKRGRTIITAFAGSIGIIGVALVLALSNGLSSYMSTMQTDVLSGFPITISTTSQNIDMQQRREMMLANNSVKYEEFPDSGEVYRYNREENRVSHTNVFTSEYLSYIEAMPDALPNAVNTISYTRGVDMNVLAKGEDAVVKYETSSPYGGMGGMASAFGMSTGTYWQEMPDNEEFVLSQYDLLGEGSRLPKEANEIALVVDEYNRLDEAFFQKSGYTTDADSYQLSDFIGKTLLKVVPNDIFYKDDGVLFAASTPADYDSLFSGSEGVDLTIVGVLRIRSDAASGYFSEGIVYTSALTDYVVESARKSIVAGTQKVSDINVLTGIPFQNEDMKGNIMLALGAEVTPTGINIYPKDFAGKDSIKDYLDAYNEGREQEDHIVYSDMAETITTMTGTLLDTVSYVLIGFAAISLLVSTIMIGVITYVSVIERTKEIGVLRSVGARKKDISRVFNAETLIVGFAAGTLGVLISYLLTIPINALIVNLVDISGIANLNPLHALALIAGSMCLTLIAGLVPARMAAKKDPVVALRTE